MYDVMPMVHPLSITASYAFFPLTEAELKTLQSELKTFGSTQGMKGLVLLAPEGINSTVCGTADVIAEWKEHLRGLKSDIVFKDSSAPREVFKKWSVKIKPELITFKQKNAAPSGRHRHLTPREWKHMLEREDVVVIDTRNTYESNIGKFKNALTPAIDNFQEFPAAMKAASIPKDKTVMMYCTGGIRCEKAIFSMEEQGYQNVYQLEGGILAYLEQFPEDAFEGECFVFDERVAVDQNLQPSSTYKLCSECGDPATSSTCTRCASITHSSR